MKKLVAIDPTPAIGEPEQDVGDAAAKNDWGQDLDTRVKQLTEACHADSSKVTAYAPLLAWNCGIFHTATRVEPPGGVKPACVVPRIVTGTLPGGEFRIEAIGKGIPGAAARTIFFDSNPYRGKIPFRTVPIFVGSLFLGLFNLGLIAQAFIFSGGNGGQSVRSPAVLRR